MKTQKSFVMRSIAASVLNLLLLTLIVTPITVHGSGGDGVAEAASSARVRIVERVVVMHHWRLIRWEGLRIVCDLFTRDSGYPSYQDVAYYCGAGVYTEWLSTGYCPNPDGIGCKGIYLRHLGEVEIIVEEIEIIPLPSISMQPTVCDNNTICTQIPRLEITTYEPLSDEGYEITAIYVRLGDEEFVCESNACVFQPPITSEYGIDGEYWAESSYGDTSARYPFKLRNQDIPEKGYRFDLVGIPWREDIAEYLVSWWGFPPVDADGTWLELVDHPMDVFSHESFAMLAGELIRFGLVDASECPAGGMTNILAANACGMSKSAAMVRVWQNIHNQKMIDAAAEAMSTMGDVIPMSIY